MGNVYHKTVITVLIAFACNFTALTQITSYQLQQFIITNKYISSNEIKYSNQLKEFYTLVNYNPVWIQKENEDNRNIILKTLQLADGLGLNEKDYQFNFINYINKNKLYFKNITDSLEAEIRITDAAIHFYNDLSYGNIKPTFGYNGLNYIPDCSNIPALLTKHILQNKLKLLIHKITLDLPEIIFLQKKIKWFQTIISNTNFKEVIITNSKVSGSNKPLLSKLYQLGLISNENIFIADSTIKQKIKEAQLHFNLLTDGVLRSTIIAQLNIPLYQRLEQLNLSVNYYRWLNCLIQNQSVIVVNIPATYLKVYQNNETILEMRIIVGKTTTKTPTLASKVDEVILYPYWHVPFSIATKELLPLIKRNPGYLDARNYQVLNKAGKIINPYSINWHALNQNYFPYTIRQSTGCDNALGLIKLNFYNPFGVYLHDTPNKNLFLLKKRFFSHGCMRIAKPMELGHLILKNNQIAIDTLIQKGCLKSKAPIIVHATVHMPVIVWYNPAGVDSTGRVIFFEDIYGKFK